MDRQYYLKAVGASIERIEEEMEEALRPLRTRKNEAYHQCKALGLDFEALVKAVRFRRGLIYARNLTPLAELYLEVLGDPRKEEVSQDGAN